jgi:tRNA dimethylallyltransferase
MAKQKKLLVIAGPTAVGKTAIAIEVAKSLGTEIISADSRQCYRGMSIGTAQPSAEERATVPHHFVDCYEVQEALSAADFERYALDQLNQIFSKSQYAVVCGGTGLYIKALCEGLDDMPAIDAIISQMVSDRYAAEGMDWLREELRQKDPEFAAMGEMENPARMLRALAFKLSVGKSIVQYRTAIKKDRPFEIINIGLELPREQLYERINQRVDIMMQQGLLQEAQQLYPQRNLKNLQTVGYTELFDYLNNTMTLEQAVDKIKQHSRNYAKRQLTWFKKDKAFTWLNAQDPHLMANIADML